MTEGREEDKMEPICAVAKRMCNLAREPFCLCWWQSRDPDDFRRKHLSAIGAHGEKAKVDD